jgi:2-polyprenyl-3-methyl-5-hydroxy-6-metoxy-1,4-benzoquinol methylase
MDHIVTERAQTAKGTDVFAFGENWQRFLRDLDDDRIDKAEKSLVEMLEHDNLSGKRFLDIGSGSGLFSLVARRLGAAVRSFDVDPASVACAKALRDQYRRDDPDWEISAGSALDPDFLGTLGQWDIVYSWGVLHHTGAMWQALENVDSLVAENGLLFIAIYNHQGGPTRRWTWVKKTYVSLPPYLRFLVLWPCFVRMWAKAFLRDVLLGHPVRAWREYSRERGMSPWRDVVDWVGGYPFEASTPEDIFEFYKKKGYVLRKLRTRNGHGCNEFVFQKLG